MSSETKTAKKTMLLKINPTMFVEINAFNFQKMFLANLENYVKRFFFLIFVTTEFSKYCEEHFLKV